MKKMNDNMASLIAPIAVLGLLLVAVGLAQEDAAILPPVDVNVTVEDFEKPNQWLSLYTIITIFIIHENPNRLFHHARI